MADKSSCSSASSCSRESCEGCPSAKGGSGIEKEPMNAASNVKKVIGVVSGKGGVGKSFAPAQYPTALLELASAMNKAGYKVGIMDADITGPSIPKMFGLHGQIYGTEAGMVPMEAEDGTKVMSINLLLDNEEEPVIWRGPVVAGVVKQFWNETYWGDIDYLFVDMPPGTGDVPLTVFQSLPVVGVVENFSYLKCPDCGKEIKVFGESHVDEVAAELGIKVLGKMPIDPAYAQSADEGRFFEMENPYLAEGVEVLKNL